MEKGKKNIWKRMVEKIDDKLKTESKNCCCECDCEKKEKKKK
ncbi:hypothetical protein ACFL0V_02095 [Nanoarchaeota archaeon]